MQVQEYYNSLSLKVKEKLEVTSTNISTKRIVNIEEALKIFAEKLNEVNESLQTFENKTEGNFKVAETAIVCHSSFINQIDSQLVNYSYEYY